MGIGREQGHGEFIGAKVSKALSSPWRARVMAELRKRPLSPSQFVREIGGERSHIARCFRQLAEWGFIELVETRTGGRRRGGVERVYRAAKEAYFPNDVWVKFPEVLRSDISAGVLQEYWERTVEARNAGTLDAEVNRHLSWDMVVLDRQAWGELIDVLDRTLLWVPEVVDESKRRRAERGGEEIPATVGIMAFRSPAAGTDDAPPRDPSPGPSDSILDVVGSYEAIPISGRLARVLANPWRAQILAELRARPMSPSQFVAEVGGDLSTIARCFRQLADLGYIEIAETRTGGTRRGGVEHVYRPIRRAYFPTPAWREFSPRHREDLSGGILASFWRRVHEAVEAGTFDAELDRHLSWRIATFDRPGWNEVVEKLDAILYSLPKLEAEAGERLERSGEEPIPTTVGLACFRSPPTSPRDR